MEQKQKVLPMPDFNKGCLSTITLQRYGPTVQLTSNHTPFNTNLSEVRSHKVSKFMAPKIIQQTKFCDPCDIELQSPEEYRVHRSQHRPCKVDGCKYSVHPTVMDKHISVFHSSALYENLKRLNTPEEIENWRRERSKRYPTLANVEMRKKAEEQRRRRGERLEAKNNRFGCREDRKRARNVTNPKKSKDVKKKFEKPKNEKFKRKQNVERNIGQKELNQNTEISTHTENTCDITMFHGTSELKNYEHKITKENNVNALSAFLGVYDSDDSGTNEESDFECKVTEVIGVDEILLTSQPDKHQISVDSENKDKVDLSTKPQDKYQSNDIHLKYSNSSNMLISHANNEINDTEDDDMPDEVPILRSNEVTVESKTNDKQIVNEQNDSKMKLTLNFDEKFKQKTGLDYRKARQRKQNTMLEKLLETEIRHERNVLLQCVRFVCENNFFGINKK